MSEDEIHGVCAASREKVRNRESAINPKYQYQVEAVILSITVYIFIVFKQAFYKRNPCFLLMLLMHIQGDLGSTCARREDGPQWTAVSLSCNSNSPWVSHSPPIKDRAAHPRLLWLLSLKGHDVLFNICLEVSLSDGFDCTSMCAHTCEWKGGTKCPGFVFAHLHWRLCRCVRTILWAHTRRYTSAVQQQCAYFKGVDCFHWKPHGSSKRSVKLASEGELACWGLCHLVAHWLKMSGFILGMLHLREISGKAVPFCSMSEYPPVVSVSAMLFNTKRRKESQG